MLYNIGAIVTFGNTLGLDKTARSVSKSIVTILATTGPPTLLFKFACIVPCHLVPIKTSHTSFVSFMVAAVAGCLGPAPLTGDKLG